MSEQKSSKKSTWAETDRERLLFLNRQINSLSLKESEYHVDLHSLKSQQD